MSQQRSRTIRIRRSDLPGGQDTVRPQRSGGEAERPLVIRLDELPGVAYIRPAGARPLRISLPKDGFRALERRMLDLINADRAAHYEESGGAGPLGWDVEAAAVALAHSQDMIARRFMAHVNPDGLAPLDRLARAGLRMSMCGENIAGSPTMRVVNGDTGEERTLTGYPDIERAEQGLMNSPGHRQNLLNRGFTHVGVGIARNEDGTLVITQNFVGR